MRWPIYRTWAVAVLEVLEHALPGRTYLLGADFSGADIMMGYTLQRAKWFGILTDEYLHLVGYMVRLEARPAFVKAFAA